MRKWLTKTISALTAGICIFGAVSLTTIIPTAQVYAADYNYKGDSDGLYYELWNQNSVGTLEYENTENHGFTFGWSSIEDAFVLKGDAFKINTVYASQIKEYTVTYDEDVNYMGGSSYSGVYGWMEDSNAYYEFYIVDSWGSWRPATGDVLGSFESNGIIYDVYKSIRAQMSCFMETPITYVYYSVARENLAENIDEICNIKNTVNVVDHFKEWQKLGLNLGFMYDVGFSVQAYRSSGSAKVNSLEISKEITGENNYGPDFTYTSHEPMTTDEEGRKVFIDFETESDDEKFGAAFTGTEASYDTGNYFSGEHSMLISGEDKARRAFEYKIDPYDFSSKELLAGLKIYQNSGRNIKFIFQKSDLNSQTGYSRDLYSRTIPSGVWTDMEDLQFLLLNDIFANEVIRIIPSEDVDFWIDDLYLGDACDIKDKHAKKVHSVYGDVNRDNAVDIYDILTLRRLLLSAEDYSINFYQDVNGDCKLNISDLVALTQFVLGKTKQIPEPEKEIVYFANDFREMVGRIEFNANSVENTAGEIKSAVCSDGTFSTQWSGKSYYELTSSQILEEFDELSLKYSGTVKTESCAVYGNESNAKIFIFAEFKNASDTVSFLIEDGSGEKERLRWHSDPDDMKLVEIGGHEYYIDKNEELPDEMESDRYIWLYPKENTIKTDEVCNFEEEVDFSEILKYFGKEEFKPYSLNFSFVTSDTEGFAEINELSCIDNSKAE
jgi:hypothetical protein